MHGLAEGDTGHGANRSYCLASATGPEALGIHQGLPAPCLSFFV